MKRTVAALLLLALAACHRSVVADVTLDADDAARNATAAKTIADLEAADAAVRAPLPHMSRRHEARSAETPPPVATDVPAIAPSDAPENRSDVAPQP